MGRLSARAPTPAYSTAEVEMRAEFYYHNNAATCRGISSPRAQAKACYVYDSINNEIL